MKESIRFTTIVSAAMAVALGFVPVMASAQAPVQSQVEHCPRVADMKKIDAVITARTATGLQWVGVMQSATQEVQRFQQVSVRPLDDAATPSDAAAHRPGVSEFTGCRYDVTRGGSLLMRLSSGRKDDDLVSKVVPQGVQWKRDVGGWGDVRYVCTTDPKKCTFTIAEKP